jgi:NAD(P)-dependent dehydrogenase (short-subunit alcohol dehydrogenase family)
MSAVKSSQSWFVHSSVVFMRAVCASRNASSAFCTAPMLTPYAATKHAVVGLSLSLRSEAAAHGDRHMAAVLAQALQIARHIVARNHVEHDVDRNCPVVRLAAGRGLVC